MSHEKTATPLLQVDSLRVAYRTREHAVSAIEDASITIDRSEAVGLVGESGSGKSTLARAVLGLLPRGVGVIEGGRILIDGRDVTRSTPRQWQHLRGNPIAIVFQDPLSYLHPLLRIGRQVAESIAVHDPEANRNERIAELLDLVRLSPAVMRAYPHELSGGMRQRVLLAIALGCRPRLLIADEPTTALDVTTQAEIMALLADLRNRLDMSLLLISHDLALVAGACERAYVMYAGRTVETGSTNELFTEPAHPYTYGLLQAASAARDDAGRFMTIGGDVPELGRRISGCPFEPRCSRRIASCADNMPGWDVSTTRRAHAVCCWQPLTAAS